MRHRTHHEVKSLLNAPKNTPLEIVRVNGGRGLRRNLARLNIGVGSKLLVRRNAPFSGPLLIEHNGVQTALGRWIAHRIIVEPAE